tara:strand:+ start:112 stop:624 length:513 start_codon:yes stop_codon:yes gene_type:complete
MGNTPFPCGLEFTDQADAHDVVVEIGQILRFALYEVAKATDEAVSNLDVDCDAGLVAAECLSGQVFLFDRAVACDEANGVEAIGLAFYGLGRLDTHSRAHQIVYRRAVQRLGPRVIIRAQAESAEIDGQIGTEGRKIRTERIDAAQVWRRSVAHLATREAQAKLRAEAAY